MNIIRMLYHSRPICKLVGFDVFGSQPCKTASVCGCYCREKIDDVALNSIVFFFQIRFAEVT